MSKHSKTAAPAPEPPKAEAPAPQDATREHFLALIRESILPRNIPGASTATLKAILKASGVKSVLSREELAEIADLQKQDDALCVRIAEHGHSSASREWKDQHGAPPMEDGQLRTKESILLQVALRRKSCKEARRNVRLAANVIAARGWNRIAEICAAFAKQREEAERAEAATWSVQFSPSPVLMAAVSVAMNGANCAEGMALHKPTVQIEGLSL